MVRKYRGVFEGNIGKLRTGMGGVDGRQGEKEVGVRRIE
jgi:hypothetical protein